MKRSLIVHPRYLGHVVPLRPLSGEATVIAVAIDTMAWFGGRSIIMHPLVRDDTGLQPVTFVEVRDDAFLIPRPYEGSGAIRPLLDALEPWLESAPLEPRFNIFAHDAGLQLHIDAGDAGRLPVFGRTPALFDAVDRYRFVARFAAGRRVVDMSDGTGYGLHVLAPFVEELAFEPPAAWAAVAGRFGFVPRPSASSTFDVALALALSADTVAERLERLRERLEGAGGMLVSARGDAGADALRDAGLEPAPLTRPGGDCLAGLDEWYAWKAPPPAVVPVESAPGVASEPPHPLTVTVAPRPLRVLFVLRGTAAQLFGGDIVQVRETASALRRRGHHVEVGYGLNFETDGYDVVHLTNITAPAETLAQAQRAQAHGGAVVLMPIFSDHADEALWGWSAIANIFNAALDAPTLAVRLRHIEDRTLGFHASPGQSVTAFSRYDLYEGYTEQQRAILRLSDFVVANAHAEMHRLYRYLEPGVPYAVAPSAVDAKTYRAEAAATFREKYRIGDFVLLPGRIEGRKNQVLFCEAMRQSGRRVVFIGRGSEAPAVLAFMAHLPANAIVIPAVSEPELAGAMAAARVVALPSWDEVVSLSSLNAAACGTSLVLTRNSYEHEYFLDDAEYVDPASIDDIVRGVDAAWNAHDRRAERRTALVQRVRREFTWDVAAEATEAAYYRVLADNPRGEARRAAARRSP